MLFTVIIPAFNAEATLARAIESCLRQTHLPFEIFVINDGSIDHTSQVAKSYFPHIKLIEFKENKGVSASRNKGWDNAKGEIVAFLDSDDEWHPQKLEIIAKYWKSNKNIAGIFHLYTLENFENLLTPNQESLSSVSFWQFLLKNKVQTSCLSIRREVPFRFNSNFRFCEDHELMIQISWHSSLQQIPLSLTKLSRPQLTKGGLSGEKWKMRKGEMKIYLNLWKLNPLFIFMIPLLCIYSFTKHLLKLTKLGSVRYQ